MFLIKGFIQSENECSRFFPCLENEVILPLIIALLDMIVSSRDCPNMVMQAQTP